jgi:hypothetical protein
VYGVGGYAKPKMLCGDGDVEFVTKMGQIGGKPENEPIWRAMREDSMQGLPLPPPPSFLLRGTVKETDNGLISFLYRENHARMVDLQLVLPTGQEQEAHRRPCGPSYDK